MKILIFVPVTIFFIHILKYLILISMTIALKIFDYKIPISAVQRGMLCKIFVLIIRIIFFNICIPSRILCSIIFLHSPLSGWYTRCLKRKFWEGSGNTASRKIFVSYLDDIIFNLRKKLSFETSCSYQFADMTFPELLHPQQIRSPSKENPFPPKYSFSFGNNR